MAVCLGGIIVGLALMFTEEKFFAVASAVVAAHLPVMIIEGIVTALCVTFLKKVQPSMLPGYAPKEVA
jgi:cobalt/nickel transport system permease protein